MAAIAGILRCSRPERKTSSMLFAARSLRDCAPTASAMPPNSLRVKRCIRLVVTLKLPRVIDYFLSR